MPPVKGKTPTQALFFREGDVARELDRPLNASLSTHVPTVTDVTGSPDAGLVQQITSPKTFDFSLTGDQTSQRGFIVLDPPTDPSASSELGLVRIVFRLLGLLGLLGLVVGLRLVVEHDQRPDDDARLRRLGRSPGARSAGRLAGAARLGPRLVAAALEDGHPRVAREGRVRPRTPAQREHRAARVADDLLVLARVAQPERHAVSIASWAAARRDSRGTGMVEAVNYHASPWRRSDGSSGSCARTAPAWSGPACWPPSRWR